MQFQISTQPGAQSFTASADQTVLEAALAAGLLLPYGCRDGACGTCKGRVVSGNLEQGQVSDSALTDQERDAGYALLCQARPRSDLILEVRTLGRVGDIPSKKLPCRVLTLEQVAPDVMILTVKLPANEKFRFRAGQYVDFLLADGHRRSFSIANPPHCADQLEFHIRLIDGGRFTAHVFGSMKPRDIMRIEGPLGSFFLREDSTRPIVLLAGGTGFAPIKSIVEHAIESGMERPITLYWGARNYSGLYLDKLARSWENALPAFKYVPVLSDAPTADHWKGRSGLVHLAVADEHVVDPVDSLSGIDHPAAANQERRHQSGPPWLAASRGPQVSQSTPIRTARPLVT